MKMGDYQDREDWLDDLGVSEDSALVKSIRIEGEIISMMGTEDDECELRNLLECLINAKRKVAIEMEKLE
jgi:hypothetical protein